MWSIRNLPAEDSCSDVVSRKKQIGKFVIASLPSIFPYSGKPHLTMHCTHFLPGEQIRCHWCLAGTATWSIPKHTQYLVPLIQDGIWGLGEWRHQAVLRRALPNRGFHWQSLRALTECAECLLTNPASPFSFFCGQPQPQGLWYFPPPHYSRELQLECLE